MGFTDREKFRVSHWSGEKQRRWRYTARRAIGLFLVTNQQTNPSLSACTCVHPSKSINQSINRPWSRAPACAPWTPPSALPKRLDQKLATIGASHLPSPEKWDTTIYWIFWSKKSATKVIFFNAKEEGMQWYNFSDNLWAFNSANVGLVVSNISLIKDRKSVLHFFLFSRIN